MPKRGGGKKGCKGAKVRLMLMKNGDCHTTHLATFSGTPLAVEQVLTEVRAPV